MAKQTYSISDLANELDITTRAIRFYEEQGMLTPTRRGQERIYSPKDRVALKLILRGKRIGFSLAECKTLIELYDPKAGNQEQLNIMLQMIADRRQQLEQQLLDIQQMQLELDTAEERCRSALESTLPSKPPADRTPSALLLSSGVAPRASRILFVQQSVIATVHGTGHVPEFRTPPHFHLSSVCRSGHRYRPAIIRMPLQTAPFLARER